MSAEENMALARRLMEARVMGDVDALDEMLTPDFVTHTRLVPDQPPGREGEKWAISQLNAALSNRTIHFEDQIAAASMWRTSTKSQPWPSLHRAVVIPFMPSPG